MRILSFSLFVVDMFYMKTCNFRRAQPSQEGIFCFNEPQAHYGLQPCNKPSCHCCHPPCRRRRPGQTPAIEFRSNQIHNFVNRYKAILNCPAVSGHPGFPLTISFLSLRHVRRAILSMS